MVPDGLDEMTDERVRIACAEARGWRFGERQPTNRRWLNEAGVPDVPGDMNAAMTLADEMVAEGNAEFLLEFVPGMGWAATLRTWRGPMIRPFPFAKSPSPARSIALCYLRFKATQAGEVKP